MQEEDLASVSMPISNKPISFDFIPLEQDSDSEDFIPLESDDEDEDDDEIIPQLANIIPQFPNDWRIMPEENKEEEAEIYSFSGSDYSWDDESSCSVFMED